jgi:hypothetical protein
MKKIVVLFVVLIPLTSFSSTDVIRGTDQSVSGYLSYGDYPGFSGTVHIYGECVRNDYYGDQGFITIYGTVNNQFFSESEYLYDACPEFWPKNFISNGIGSGWNLQTTQNGISVKIQCPRNAVDKFSYEGKGVSRYHDGNRYSYRNKTERVYTFPRPNACRSSVTTAAGTENFNYVMMFVVESANRNMSKATDKASLAHSPGTIEVAKVWSLLTLGFALGIPLVGVRPLRELSKRINKKRNAETTPF